LKLLCACQIFFFFSHLLSPLSFYFQKRVYVDLLAQLQSRLIEASSKKAARRSRSMPRKIDFTVESFDSPKLRAVQMQHRSLQKQRMGRPRGMQLRNQRKAPDASRSIDDDDDEDDDNANDEGAGSSDDEDDADDLLVDSDDDDDVDEDDDDDDVVASVTPIASTPIRSGVDRDHGPTAASVFVDFVLFFCGAAAVVIGGGRLLDFAFGEKIFVLP
jgi:hypothetical protein